jgi:uncharacterized hydrophobic protein (TIGR00271 family)
MSLCVVIGGADDAATLTHWSLRFATALGEHLLILYAGNGTQTESRVIDAPESSEDPVIAIIYGAIMELGVGNRAKVTIKRALSVDRLACVQKELEQEKPRLLILAKQRSSREGHADSMLARQVFDQATCQSLLMRFGQSDGRICKRIVIPTAGGPHAIAALKIAAAVATVHPCEIVPLYIEPDGDDLSKDVGEHLLETYIRKSGIKEDAQITPRVVVSNSVNQGITQVAEEGCDLLIVGATRKSIIRQGLFGTVPERLLQSENSMAIAMIKTATPLHHRISDAFERWLDVTVPQLDRADRIALFEGLQTHSRWNFDFLALIGLSTSIATLGLIQDSTSVVIGAMLVAPLMSPLLGCGLSITQANFPLFKSSLKSIILGFLVALGIGLFFGWLSPLEELTHELRARGGPTLLDVGVAFLSGTAAAYCTGRPNLSGALPGVAIAAALVPPIGTVGVSLALMDFGNAQGAALLFATNVVCIILGSSVAFFAGGVRARAEQKQSTRWVQRTVLGLVLAMILFSVPLGTVIYDQFKQRSSVKLSKPLRAELKETLHTQLQARIIRTHTAHRNGGLVIELWIRSPKAPDHALTNELADIALKHLKSRVRVRIETELVIEASHTEEPTSFKAPSNHK